MLRILVISHYFWPESFRINQVVEDLIAGGAHVTVLTGHPSYPGGKVFPGYDARRTRLERHPAGYDIYRVPVVPRGQGNHVRLALNYLSFTVTGILFGTRLLRKQRFDVLFVYCTTPVIQGYIGLWLKLVKRARLVLWVQDLWPQALSATGFVKSRFLLRAVGYVVRVLYRRCDLILGQSQAFVAMIEPDAGSVPVHYFPNPGEHPPAASHAGAPALPGKFNVIFAGNLGKAQALKTVVDAAEMLRADRDIHITLFGSGSMTEWIEAEVKSRALANLTLGGRLPPEKMPGVYRQASALLLTLVDDKAVAQTVPSKLQSYLSAGVPIIVAVNGEAADIVADAGAGIACRAEDPAALAGAIAALKSSPAADRAAMGEAARRFFDANYRPEKLARELLDRLARLASGEPQIGSSAGVRS
jgi:glycosyltransferase involved in cell wall biosynthesis